MFNISIDELLDEEHDVSESAEMPIDIVREEKEKREAYTCAKYANYYCNIELDGWNDGVSDVIICGEDERSSSTFRSGDNKQRLFLCKTGMH